MVELTIDIDVYNVNDTFFLKQNIDNKNKEVEQIYLFTFYNAYLIDFSSNDCNCVTN